MIIITLKWYGIHRRGRVATLRELDEMDYTVVSPSNRFY